MRCYMGLCADCRVYTCGAVMIGRVHDQKAEIDHRVWICSIPARGLGTGIRWRDARVILGFREGAGGMDRFVTSSERVSMDQGKG